jgi:competence CoiA-like predicted nuclease
MPWIALDVKTNQRIKSYDFKTSYEIRDMYPEIVCPDCEKKMHPRAGVMSARRVHFAHNAGECTSKIERHPFSIQHEESVLALAFYIEKFFSQNPTKIPITVEVEYRMPTIGQHGRIADIALLINNDVIEVHEVQYSDIVLDVIKGRTNDYADQGIECRWHFGGNYINNEGFKSWFVKEFGYFSTPFHWVEELVVGANNFSKTKRS